MKESPIKFFVFPFVFLLAFALVSCHDTYTLCDQALIVNAKGDFYTLGAGGTAVPAPPVKLTVTGIAGNPLITNVENPVVLSLNLTPNTDSAKFIFSLGALPKDTLSFFYSTEDTFVSQNCGSIKTYTLSKVKTTGHTVDSVSIINNEVANRLALNVRFFY